MNLLLYPRLATLGISKNRRLYFPYILTCIGSVMMLYIIHSLSYSPSIAVMRGGTSLEFILSLGKFVIAVFSLLFLSYTGSFLAKRRNREFGLYNILGMNKRDISRIVFCETLFTAVLGLVGGMFFGILFSKFAELGLANMIGAPITYEVTVSRDAIFFTVMVFSVIFIILLIKSLLSVLRAKPLELFHSENVGERPPRSKPLIAALGTLLLVGAYIISVTIKSPFSALLLFFVAVIMVMIATYLLFTAGSVSLCGALKKNKGLYYRKPRFFSVSSMAFRMKRNGAGLASICILSTMVLVTISATTCLYIGVEDTLRNRYPHDNRISTLSYSAAEISEEKRAEIRERYYDVLKSHQTAPENVEQFAYAAVAGVINAEFIDLGRSADTLDPNTFDRFIYAVFIDKDDYCAVSGQKLGLGPNEAYIKTDRLTYNASELTIGPLKYEIVGKVDAVPEAIDLNNGTLPIIYLITDNLESLSVLTGQASETDENAPVFRYLFTYDLPDVSSSEKAQILNEQKNTLADVIGDENGYSYSAVCRDEERADFYNTFGALFFLGIILSLLFICAAALIIYYKQLSEGFEDRQRFEIMQKLGMTLKDIRKSVNSQMLTVFYAPLFAAGMHMVFAFPMLWKMLQLFELRDMKLMIITCLVSFAAFAAIYAAIYKLTASAYVKIVSSSSERA